MAIPITSYPDKVQAPDSDYPSGRPINNDGSGQATRMNRETLGDMWQFFFKMIRVAGITPNGLPDNEYSGNQYYQALLLAATGYKSYVAIMSQVGNLAPSVDYLMPNNGVGNIIWTRLGTGVYLGSLPGQLTRFKTIVSCRTLEDNGLARGFVRIAKDNSSSNTVRLTTFDDTFTASDDILLENPVEIKVFY